MSLSPKHNYVGDNIHFITIMAHAENIVQRDFQKVIFWTHFQIDANLKKLV